MENAASILCMYAITPCHAGSGSSTGVVDLPIQRERHTNWPIVQASGMKGAMRAHFDRYKGAIADKLAEEQFAQLTDLVFGSEKSEYAGSLSVSDAKILAFPMRSNVAPFVWVTCPAALKRLNKDLHLAGKVELDLAAIKELPADQALWFSGSFQKGDHILLEDMEVVAESKVELKNGEICFRESDRLLVVHDEVFGYAVSHCTSIMAQIKIDQATGTTSTGSLRYQEELPADTLMYSVVFWGNSRDGKASLAAETIRGFVERDVLADHLQVGGDETLGRGIFSLTWI
ncbi:MAG: type III-B CRISPR module RAMP protein Cmr4 [Desulfocapsaceae bacterium]|nr:type III-B CRISPR module RAMP protein Cmr4 [Desulfocapsaceae bacterium]